MTKLASAIDHFKTAKTLSGRAEKTLEQYEYVLSNFGEYLDCNPNIEDIDKNDVRGFIQHLLDRDLSQSTVAIHHRVLRSFFNWLLSEKELESSPMRSIQEPTTPNQFPRILSQEQVDTLLNSARERIDCWSGLRNFAMIITFLDMGLRRQELIDAQLNNLNLEGRSLKVNGKGAKDRRVHFGQATARIIKKWLKVRESIRAEIKPNTVFIGQNGEKLKCRNVNRLIERMQDRAGLHDCNISPHVLRHTSATMAVENGMDPFSLKRQFGWENMQSAMKYIHITGKRLSETFKKNSPIDNMGKGYNRNNDRNDRGEWVSR